LNCDAPGGRNCADAPFTATRAAMRAPIQNAAVLILVMDDMS
jgi:hypothetical protein